MRRAKLNDLNWCFPAAAMLLGTLGGWSWKWLRRYALPITGGLLAFAYGVRWWRAALYSVATAAAFALPYSPDRHGWPVIFLVGATYGATPWILRFKRSRLWWPLLSCVALAGLLWFSSIAPWWTHKWTEAVVFGLHGFMVSWTIDWAKGR